MKNLSYLLLAILLLMAFMSPQADSYVIHVDTEYILNKMSAYQKAQKELEQLALSYKKEIDEKKKELDSLFKVYEENELLLTAEMRMKLKNQILQKDREIKELQKKYFAPDGLLAKKREEKLKPIMENLYQTIGNLAKELNADYVFDKATGKILYANPNRDFSDAVLKKLGIQ